MQTLITPILQAFPSLKQWVIPSYQRNYVWTGEGQWRPLWEDIMALVKTDADSHFLGTIITKQSIGQGSFINFWWVVDGQQRLTTLQLLIAAARACFVRNGLTGAKMLEPMLVNGEGAKTQEDRYKVRHKQSASYPASDYVQFQKIIETSLSNPDAAAPSDSRLGDCYNFFRDRMDEWMQDIDDGERETRAADFIRAIQQKLVVVDIQLDQSQNSHAIFEALNARGEPLSPWEKVKNYFLSLAVREDDPDGDRMYREHLERYDADPYWKERIGDFLQYFTWLEVPRTRLAMGRGPATLAQLRANRIYREFRFLGEHIYRNNRDEFEEMLLRLRRYADLYRQLDERTGDYSEYARKVMERRHVLELGTLTPVFMVLMNRMGTGKELDDMLRILDSYLMRRVARKSSYMTFEFDGVTFVLTQELRDTENIPAVLLSRLFAISGWNSWPGDIELMEHFRTGDMYRRISARRLRMLLEDIAEYMHDENKYNVAGFRVVKAEIEHVAPRQWKQHWKAVFGFDGSDEDAPRIDRLIHRIGNLTLFSSEANSAGSNNSWDEKKASIEI